MRQSTPVTSLLRNMSANFIGRLWTALLSLLFVPVYIRLIGVEAYGLIGFSVTMQSVLLVLDLGLSSALVREMARLSANGSSSQDQRDLVRTFEYLYWMMAVAGGLFIALVAPWIASSWIHSTEFSSAELTKCVILMGVALVFRLPYALYQGGLVGLQRQGTLNSMLVSVTTLKALGALAVLFLISPTIYAYLTWELAIAGLQTGTARALLNRALPKSLHRPAFRWTLLRSTARFAMGMLAISLVTTVLMQIDKVLLSKLLPLESFGYYMVAAALGNGICMLVNPIQTAAFPRLSQIVAVGDDAALRSTYHLLCQIVASVSLPAALVIGLFPHEILMVWIGKPAVAQHAGQLVTFIALGWGFNSLMAMPYALQLAHGWTKLAFYVNLASAVAMIPFVVVSTHYYGALGGALSWAALNLIYVLSIPHLMHARLLTTEKWRWFREDVVPQLAVVTVLVGSLRILAPMPVEAPVMTILLLMTTWLLAYVGCVFASPLLRNAILSVVTKWRRPVTESRTDAQAIASRHSGRPGGKVPFFSIIVPTMNRPELCVAAIQTVMGQSFGDFELIVSDNSTEEDLQRETESAVAVYTNDSRVRYVRPEKFLSMPDHWEFASRHATGCYVLILTDRHVMRPSALAVLNSQLQAQQTPVICWHDYSSFDNRTGDVSTPPYTGKVIRRDSKELAAAYGDFRAPRSYLPHALNTCYESGLAESIRQKHGRLFHLIAPDDTSAFLLLAYTDTVLFIDAPLYMFHGQKSNGQECLMRGLRYYTDTLGDIDVFAHVPTPIDCVVNVMIGDMLTMKELVKPRLDCIALNVPAYYLAIYRELVQKEHSGAQLDVGAMRADWEAAVANLTPEQRAEVELGRKDLDKTRPRLPGVRRMVARWGATKFYHRLLAPIRKLQNRLRKRRVYADVFAAAIGTDTILQSVRFAEAKQNRAA